MSIQKKPRHGQDNNQPIITVPNGAMIPPPLEDGQLSPELISNHFKKEFKVNLTDYSTLTHYKEKLDPGEGTNEVYSNLVLAEMAMGQLSELEKITTKISLDATKTIGAKMLLKEKLTEKYLGNMESTIANLDKAIMLEQQVFHKELFTHEMKLTPEDVMMIPFYMEEYKNKDISILNSSRSKSESKISLHVMENYPSIISTDTSITDGLRSANVQHSPGVVHQAENLKDLKESLKTLTGNYSRMKREYLNPQLMDTLKGGKI